MSPAWHLWLVQYHADTDSRFSEYPSRIGRLRRLVFPDSQNPGPGFLSQTSPPNNIDGRDRNNLTETLTSFGL